MGPVGSPTAREIDGGGEEQNHVDERHTRQQHRGESAAAKLVVVRVVERLGLEAVSVRSVAGEARVSIGAVQYHFPTKEDLLLAAYGRAIDQVAARAQAIAAQSAGPGAYVRALLLELLPLDERRAAELRVAVAFTARSVYSPRLTALYTDGYRALTDAIAEALGQAMARGEAAAGVDPRRDAIAAVAVADGLAWHLLCAPKVLSPEHALAALDAHLDRILRHDALAP